MVDHSNTNAVVPWGQRLRQAMQVALHETLQFPPVRLARTLLRRFAPPIVYLGDHTVLTKTRFGLPIVLDTRDVHIFPEIIFYGVWEPHVTSLILRRVRPGMHAVDIGANVGYHTLLLASRVMPHGRVTAFEANPHNFELLQRSLVISGMQFVTTAVPQALVDRPQKVTLETSTFCPGSSSLYTLPSMYAFGGVTRYEVDGTTLDDYLANGDARVDFIKLDVEGAEPLVFQGMQACIARNPQLEIVLEFNRERFAASGHDAAGFLHMLHDLGFRFAEIGSRGQLHSRNVSQVLEREFTDLLLRRNT